MTAWHVKRIINSNLRIDGKLRKASGLKRQWSQKEVAECHLKTVWKDNPIWVPKERDWPADQLKSEEAEMKTKLTKWQTRMRKQIWKYLGLWSKELREERWEKLATEVDGDRPDRWRLAALGFHQHGEGYRVQKRSLGWTLMIWVLSVWRVRTMGMAKVVPGGDCEKRDSSLKASTPACKAARSTERSLIKRKTGRIVVWCFKFSFSNPLRDQFSYLLKETTFMHSYNQYLSHSCVWQTAL